MKISFCLIFLFSVILSGCTIQTDASNELTAWSDEASANRENKQQELIRKQDATLKRQQKEFEDLHRQEIIQDEYKRRNLRQPSDDGDDSYS